jgi:glycosyltransferase involved in cell wall biosynthesis
MSTPLVSVCITTYNRAGCIVRCVESALAQTYPAVEVVVVDDGSTDETPAIVERTWSGEPRVRYVRQQNAGVNVARNHGFRLARGAYVALLDSDDVFLPWKIELEVACLRAAPEAGMVWTNMDAIDAEGRVTHRRYLQTMYSNYRRFSFDSLFPSSRPLAEIVPALREIVGDARLYVGDVFSPMVMGNLSHTSTALLTRERLDRVGGFDESLLRSGVDFDFHLRVCREGVVAYADVASILYQIGATDQMTHPSRRVRMAENFLRTIAPVIERDRARITLTQDMLDDLFAEAHGFLGQALLDAGDDRRARRELAESLRLKRDPHVARQLLLALLPDAGKRVVRGAYRALKARLPRRAGEGTPGRA